MESHLLQMRGLKLLCKLTLRVSLLSHLLQMRGLKPLFEQCSQQLYRSHLLQMRGLKPANAGAPAYITSRIFYRCVD